MISEDMFPILALSDFETQLVLELGYTSSCHRRVVGGKYLNQYLLREIDDFLTTHGVALRGGKGVRGIGLMAVGLGPGVYSRLRVILTWAKTAAYFLKIPLLGFDSFRIIDFWLNWFNRWQGPSVSPIYSSFGEYGLDNRAVEGDFPYLSNSAFINSLRKNPFRLYCLQPTPHHLLVCPYWEGRQLAAIITAEKWLTSLNQFGRVDQNLAGAGDDGNNSSDLKEVWIRKALGGWINGCLLENEGFTAGEKQKIQLQINSQEKLFFLIDELSPAAPIRQSNPLFLSKQNDGLFFILRKEMETANEKKSNNLTLFPGVYELAKQELRSHSPEELRGSAITVNPLYGREFGE